MSRGPYPVMLMLAMALPGAVRALGLGEIRVDSQLNEPLSAQIDIVGATRDDLAALTAKVAGRDIFQRYGADRPSFLSSATFKVGLDAQGRPVLNIRSADAFTDPVIDFLVDISWGKGELIREYSLLLDPPGFAPGSRTTQVAAAAAAPAARTAAVATPARNALTSNDARSSRNVLSSRDTLTSRAQNAAPAVTAPAATAPAASDRAAAAAAAAATGTLLRVAAGDTLRGIARRAGSHSEADAQRLMIAIFRANPHAFEGNINLLHRGALLRIPSDLEIAAIDTAVATREVRAQTTAWRQDGRSAGLHSVAAATSPNSAHLPPADARSSAELQQRVQSLEQALDAMNRELAAENAKIQNLKQLTAEPATSPPVGSLHAASQPTAPLPADSPPAGSLPAASQPASRLPTAPLLAASLAASQPAASPPAGSLAAAQPAAPLAAAAQPAAPLAAAVQPSPNPALGSPLHAELMQSQAHPAPVLAPVAPPPAPPLVNKAQLGSMAVALVLLLGGFAYVRRRLARAGAELPSAPLGYVPPDTSTIERPEPQEPRHEPLPPVAAPPSLAPEPLAHATAMAPDPTAATAPLAVLADPQGAAHAASLEATAAHEIPPHKMADDDTDYMGIDTQALERSYLEGLATDSMAVDTATHRAVPYEAGAHEAAPHDTASHEAVPYAASVPKTAAHDASDTMVAPFELPTVMMEQPKIDSRKTDLTLQDSPALTLQDSAALDYDLLDLDATAHHVHLSGNLYDQPSAVERRMNLVDVLKSAIERDPHRRDLVLKLLETYYGAVSSNQRAFLDIVRKIPRDRDFLTKEDWRKVEMMGRDIAPRDPLFAIDIKGDLLPSFA